MSGDKKGVLPPEERAVEDTVVDPPRGTDASEPEKTQDPVLARVEALYGRWDTSDDEELPTLEHGEVDRLLQALGQRIAQDKAGPQTISPYSDGGSNVAYEGVGRPARGRWLRDPTGKVLLKDDGPKGQDATAAVLEAPTVLVERVLRRARVRRRMRLALAGMGLVVGGAGAVGALLSAKGGNDNPIRSSPTGEVAAVAVASSEPAERVSTSAAPSQSSLTAEALPVAERDSSVIAVSRPPSRHGGSASPAKPPKVVVTATSDSKRPPPPAPSNEPLFNNEEP